MDKKPIHEELERRPEKVVAEAAERNRMERGQGEPEEFFPARKSVVFIAGILILFGLYLSSLYNFLLFHTLAEVFSIVVACGIFMIAWNSRRILDNNYLLFIGIAFLFIGVLDLVHTLAYKGMNVFQGYETNLPTQLWIATRYMESLSLLIAPLFLLGQRLRANLVLMAYALTTSLVLGSVFYWHIFPACFVEGVGLTSFKKVSEYVISIILIGAIAVLFQKRKEFDKRVFRMLVASIALTIASELAFTFYIHAYGFSNLVGHYFKIISFYLIYKAIIETGLMRPYDLLFRNLKQGEDAFRESEAQKAAILDGITNNLAFVNGNLEILWANKTAADSVNRTVDEMIGRKCYELWADSDSPCDDCPTIKAFETKRTEQTIIHTPDERVWEEKGEPVFDGKGRLIGVLEIAHDITARARAEEALRESEKRLIEAQHIANMGDFTWDVETGEVTWSDGLFDLLQYDKSEGIDYARVNEEIHHPDDLERVTQWLNDCIASGKAELTPNEYRLVRKDGNILYVRTLGVIEREVGKPAKVFATIQDITERKQMEGEIRESEEKIRVLYNNSPDMSASVSPHDASILQCNETLLNKTGYSREEVIGSPIFKMYHNDCMAEVKKTFQEFVETGVIRDRELTLKRKDGSKIDVSLNVNAIRGQAGEKIYSMSSWRDITERKQAELELIKAKHKAEEGEKRFRAFIEQSPVAIALFNLDGTGMYANQKYLNVLGLKSLGDFIGRPAHEYFAPQFREESKERSRRRLLGLPVPVEFESIALHSDGSEFPMQVAVGAIKLSAGETVNISFIANISDRRQAEEALRESEEKYRKLSGELEQSVQKRTTQLEAANKELESFAYSVSHDLRAPLRGIDGFSQALLEDCEERLNEEGKDYLARIRLAAQRMEHLIDDLLRLSRLTRAELRHEAVNLSKAAEEILKELRESAPERELKIEITPNLNTRGDRYLLRVALENLLSNAWKFTSSQARARIEFGVEKFEGENVYFVRDDGVGFDMTYADKLFGAFQRLHGTTEFPGSGIGLATVQRIIHRHEGRIWAKSEVGKGSTFYFTL